MNNLAKTSVKACAALGGYLEGEFATPPNEVARTIFTRLITSYLAEQLGNEDPHPVCTFSVFTSSSSAWLTVHKMFLIVAVEITDE